MNLTQRQTSWLALAAMWLGLMLLAAMRPLAVPDEGRYGEIGRWMLQSGDWMTPRLNGIPFFHKPPYLYWLQIASLSMIGVNEIALRLIPALHAGLMLVALYLSARRLTSERTARRAAVMLGTSLTFLIGGQYINHDMLVAAWIGVAIWCFGFSFMAADKPDATLARWGFVACAMGVLSKGLIGFALPGLVLFIWLLWSRQFKKLLYLPWVSGLALFLAIALPWFVVEHRSFPELYNYMFVNHHFSRFTAKSFNNSQPWWFFLLALVLLLFPWVLFAVRQLRPATVAESLATPAWKLCWTWAVAITVFFSMPNSKLVGYILPVMPPLALLAALGWQQMMNGFRFAPLLFAVLCSVNIAVALGLVTQVGRVTAPSRTQDIARVLACELHPSDTVYASGAFPYDLPFYMQSTKPMVIVQDWAAERKNAGDGWQRELFEGAEFDAAAATLLQPPEALVQAARVPGNWWVVPNREPAKLLPAAGWQLAFQGKGFNLYKSGEGSAAERPKSAEQKGLPGCKDQSHK